MNEVNVLNWTDSLRDDVVGKSTETADDKSRLRGRWYWCGC